MQLKASITRELSVDFIDGIFVTAFEGGINYWCDHAVSQYEGEHVVSTKLHYKEDEDEPKTTEVSVDTAAVVDALTKIIEGIYQCRVDLREAITRAVFDLDAGNIDADCADVVVQYAAFKELVYG
jgi:hypothetical protein